MHRKYKESVPAVHAFEPLRAADGWADADRPSKALAGGATRCRSRPVDELSHARARTAGMQNLSFPDMLALIEDRSAALREAAAQAGLAAQVPGCPDWTVADLVTHLGQVQMFWAAAVAAGPAEDPPAEDVIGDREPHGELLAWSADATARLTAALTDAGPNRICWTWWEDRKSVV